MKSKNVIGFGKEVDSIKQKPEVMGKAWLSTQLKTAIKNSKVSILEMTPDEYKNGGELLSINYHFAESPFGSVIVASTFKGICYMAFFDGEKEGAILELRKYYPNAKYRQYFDNAQQTALFLFTQEWSLLNHVNLHIKGTPFQLKVWDALLSVPIGGVSTYAKIAKGIKQDRASRAVGSAVGSNPVAFLIPCHRVIRSSGEYGKYHWGSTRKIAMIDWEANKTFVNTQTLLQ
jgi:AraC family transcriptional regulator, regulatory protein of adaptative response / methylated-DNA-[protein]-cysteine methyltransferase